MIEDISYEDEDFSEDGLEESLGERADNRGKPAGFRCWQPNSDKKVHNTVLIDYIDHGRGYEASHCKAYSKSHPEIEYLQFHTKKNYEGKCQTIAACLIKI